MDWVWPTIHHGFLLQIQQWASSSIAGPYPDVFTLGGSSLEEVDVLDGSGGMFPNLEIKFCSYKNGSGGI